MGCDIHLFIEYKEKDYPGISNFGEEIYISRNYYLFGLMNTNIRGGVEGGFSQKGLPENLSYTVENANHININEEFNDDSGDYVSLEKAKQWEKYGSKIIYNEVEKPIKVTHPDWHGHSWLSTEEFETVLEKMNKEQFGYKCLEADVVLAILKKFKELDIEARVVFWFDN